MRIKGRSYTMPCLKKSPYKGSQEVVFLEINAKDERMIN